MDYLTGPIIEPKSGNVKRIVVMLHGVGSNGDDLACLAPVIAEDLPDTLFFSPNGIQPYDMAPPEFQGYQWFSLNNRSPVALLQGASDAASFVNPALDELLRKYNLTNRDLALLGFSQGTMTALYTALHRSENIAGVVGFSGALIGADVHPHHYTARPPICLIHGEEDMVVPFSAMAHAHSTLSNAGVLVQSHARPLLAHTIDMEGIKIAQTFLLNAFA
jgi:phospholipase/carboxylesterase